jgi:hypothetical protein
MKKIRIMMTMAAFALAIAGAVTSNALTPPPNIYAYTYEGYCIQAQQGAQLPAGCNSSSGNRICTMYFEDHGELGIYNTRWSEAECVFPYIRW